MHERADAMLQYLLQYFGTLSVLASAAALQSLIAIWAATSPRHWFWRALAVWAAIMALVPIRAYQPAVIFAISSPLIVAAIVLTCWRQRAQERRATGDGSAPPPPAFRFGLSDIFLLMLLVGLSLAGMLHVRERLEFFNSTNYALTATALIAVSVISWVLFQTRRRVAWGVLLVATIGALATVIPKLGVNSEDFDALTLLGVTFHPMYRLHDAFRIAAALGEFAALLLLAPVLLRASRRQSEQSPHPRIPRGILAAITLLVGLPLAAIYWQMLWLSPLPPNFDTGSTNYDRLVQIAARMQALGTASPAATAMERSALIAETTALAQPPNFIPYDMDNLVADPLRDQFTRHTKGAQSLRDLVRAIDGEARAAIAQGNYARACELTLTNVRLGVMLQRGGSVIECMVGIARQRVGQQRITDIRRELPPDESRRVIAALEQALLEAEDAHAVARRDRAMGERCYGWGPRLDNVVESAGIGTSLDYLPQTQLRRTAIARLLQADLAIRLYQREYGELPRDLEQLVPAYLPELPIDPYSGQLLRYRNQGTDFILYSVGKDGRDDGGKFTNSATYHRVPAAGYDYDLDTQTRP
jgi:hypothetical protein